MVEVELLQNTLGMRIDRYRNAAIHGYYIDLAVAKLTL